LTFEKCLYLRGRLQLTTARRLSAYMSLRALATTTTSSIHNLVTASVHKWTKMVKSVQKKRHVITFIVTYFSKNSENYMFKEYIN